MWNGNEWWHMVYKLDYQYSECELWLRLFQSTARAEWTSWMLLKYWRFKGRFKKARNDEWFICNNSHKGGC